jgi:chemotaxis protein CheD
VPEDRSVGILPAYPADEIIEVGLAQFAVAAAPTRLISYSLGSCVALVLFDRRARLGGLAHVMLPNSNSSSPTTPAKFANHAVETLLEAMEQRGGSRRRITAKLVGGASLFKPLDGDAPSMGDRNVAALKEHLSQARIRLVAEDTGGDFARTVTFSPQDGTVKVRTVARGDYEI